MGASSGIAPKTRVTNDPLSNPSLLPFRGLGIGWGLRFAEWLITPIFRPSLPEMKWSFPERQGNQVLDIGIYPTVGM